jgi:8-oxo-dGTP diphosphatase
MTALPPGKTVEDKLYVGYYDADKLIAVMDLIIGYPEADTVYVGFFMTDVSVQGKCIGSSIISELSRFVSDSGFYKIQLGWVKGNPQPEHFWHKNGFCETGKTYDMDDFTVVEARRDLKYEQQKTVVKFYDSVNDSLLKFAVIIAKKDGQWVLCKHKERDTFEVPGGHREPAEKIGDTAKRELYEETGATKYSINPICVYSVTAPDNFDGEETFGGLYYADIEELETELHSEIEKVYLLDELPEKWTYPLIQPRLLEEATRRGYL